MLEKEFKYFQANKENLIREYNNRYIVIKGQKVISDFSSREEALEEAQKTHAVGTFLIQRVSANDDESVQRFYSRVSFHGIPQDPTSRFHN